MGLQKPQFWGKSLLMGIKSLQKDSLVNKLDLAFVKSHVLGNPNTEWPQKWSNIKIQKYQVYFKRSTN